LYNYNYHKRIHLFETMESINTSCQEKDLDKRIHLFETMETINTPRQEKDLDKRIHLHKVLPKDVKYTKYSIKHGTHIIVKINQNNNNNN